MRNGIATTWLLVVTITILTYADFSQGQNVDQPFIGPPDHTFSFSTSALLIGRNPSDDVPRIFRESDFSPVFGAGDIDFSPEIGVLMEATFFGDNGEDLQFRYTGLSPFYESVTVSANEPLIPFLFGGIPVTPVNSYQVIYLSQFHSGEINHLWRKGKHAVLLGLRFIELREEFNVLDADGIWETDTDNDLYGIQWGANINVYESSGCFWSVNLRAGAYYNNADISGDFIDPVSGGDLDLRDDEDVIGFASEVHILGRIAMGPSANLLLGYNLLWLAGVGLAPDQLDSFDVFTGQGSLNKGTILFHGGQLGVELVW